MNGYFYTLLVASVCGAVCSTLAWGGFEKYIKYIASLVCVCLMISPFRDIDIDSAIDFDEKLISVSAPETEGGLYTIAYGMTETRTEEYISEIVFAKFGIKPVYADIKIDWATNEATITDISVALSKQDMAYADKTKAYLLDTLGGEVNIIEV